MDKTILVVEIIKYKTMGDQYTIKKHAKTLEEATRYKVSLETLNEMENTSYKLFNEFGQLEYDQEEENKKVESEGTDEIRF